MSTKEWLKDRTRFRTLETNEKLELLVTHANELNRELTHLRLLNWVFAGADEANCYDGGYCGFIRENARDV